MDMMAAHALRLTRDDFKRMGWKIGDVRATLNPLGDSALSSSSSSDGDGCDEDVEDRVTNAAERGVMWAAGAAESMYRKFSTKRAPEAAAEAEPDRGARGSSSGRRSVTSAPVNSTPSRNPSTLPRIGGRRLPPKSSAGDQVGGVEGATRMKMGSLRRHTQR
jgi:hypothetical protein